MIVLGCFDVVVVVVFKVIVVGNKEVREYVWLLFEVIG